MTYYVKYSRTTNTAATGTRVSPFTSINQAATKLGAGTFELLLLENNVSLTSSITFPANSSYLIRYRHYNYK